MNDEREVGQLIAVMCLLWPTVPVRDIDAALQGAVWFRVLADVSYAEAEAVLVAHARTGAEYPPAVGVIAERVLSLREQADGTFAPDPDQAVAEVMAGVRHGGLGLLDPKRDPRHQWSHPAVAATVRAMGWRDICLSDKPDVVRAQFLRLYGDARARYQTERRRTPAIRALIAGASRPELPPTTTTTGEPDDSTDEPARDDGTGGADVVPLEPGPERAARRARRTS